MVQFNYKAEVGDLTNDKFNTIVRNKKRRVPRI